MNFHNIDSYSKIQTIGLVEEALEVATDPDYRFGLPIQLGKLDIAMVITPYLNKRDIY